MAIWELIAAVHRKTPKLYLRIISAINPLASQWSGLLSPISRCSW